MSTQFQTQSKVGSKSSDMSAANYAVKHHFANQRGFSAEAQRYQIQTKLKIGQPGDKYEQEADRIANTVMSMPDPALQLKSGWPLAQDPSCREKDLVQAKPIGLSITPLIQRQPIEEEEEEEEEELQMKPLSDHTIPLVQRQSEEEEEEEVVQAKESFVHSPTAAPGMQAQINAMIGGGQPLPESTRAFFEPRFGYDFSQVRVHQDAEAAKISSSMNARAFTLGRDIWFSAGRFQPAEHRGKSLIAHELAHVVQQTKSNTTGHRNQIHRSEADTRALCPRYYRYDTYRDVERYNCAGLAFRTYRNYKTLGNTKAQLFSITTPGARCARCSVSGSPGEVKFWLWDYDIRAEAGPHRGPTRRSFHIVAGVKDRRGNDPTDVYSKNGKRPVRGPGTGPSFTPPSRSRSLSNDRRAVPENFRGFPKYAVRTNFRARCYIVGC